MLPEDPMLRQLSDQLDDVTRALARQSAVLAELGSPRRAAADAPDLPLLVDLHTLRLDALACASTARSRRERAAFDALAAGLERLLVGRGGTVLAPEAGTEFRGAQMEAVEVVPTDDPSADRTVAALVTPGLEAGGRTVRPARVAVHRTR